MGFGSFAQMSGEDEAIGLVRAHRWLSATGQAKRLKEAGCSRIFDLDKHDRADMERIAGRRVVRLVYAFLLANPDKTRGMWADFLASLGRIEARQGVVVDVGTGLDSLQHKAAFRAVVRDQVRRHNQGGRAEELGPKGKPGRHKEEFSRGQWKLARDIWKDKTNYPTEDDADAALRRIKSKKGRPFTKHRAYLKWRGRGPKE
jgi:hypothetical protein